MALSQRSHDCRADRCCMRPRTSLAKALVMRGARPSAKLCPHRTDASWAVDERRPRCRRFDRRECRRLAIVCRLCAPLPARRNRAPPAHFAGQLGADDAGGKPCETYGFALTLRRIPRERAAGRIAVVRRGQLPYKARRLQGHAREDPRRAGPVARGLASWCARTASRSSKCRATRPTT